MISVVVPAHNEEDYLERAVVVIVDGLRHRDRDFEIIVCENGSTDHTAEVAQGLERRFEEVRMVTLRDADYGRALRAGFEAGAGQVVVNFDVDYVDLTFLDAALAQLDGPSPSAIVVASKRSPGAEDTRSLARRAVTTTFSLILKSMFNLGVSDTHGMKVLARAPVAPIVGQCRFGADLFDTELVIRAERAGLRVTELPVTVSQARPSRTSIVRRIPRSLAGLVRLRLSMWEEARRTLSGHR